MPTGLFSPGEQVEYDYGYRELATQVVSGKHLHAPA
jgi:hypothetical protein